MKNKKILTWLSLLILLTTNFLSPILAVAEDDTGGRVKVSYSPNGQLNAGGNLVNDQLATGGTYTVRSIGTGADAVNFSPTSDNLKKIIFDSWNTRADGLGDSYKPGQVVNSWNYSGEVILYAQWANAATLSYSLNGTTGNTAPSSTFQKIGSTIVLPDIPSGLTSSAAHTHVDAVWNTAVNGSGTDYNPGDSYVLQADTTLYVKIIADTPEENAKLTFDLNGGSTTSADLNNGVTATNEALTLPEAIPSKDGYTFSGWKINDKLYQAGNTLSLPYSTTAVAQWTKTLYTTITFSSTGTVTDMPSNTVVVSDGSNWTIPSDVPTRNGFTFINWTYTVNGQKATANPGDSIKLTSTTTTLSFVAVWKEDNPVLNFNLNNGVSDSTDFSNGIKATNGSVTLPTTTPTRAEYTFSGWKINGSVYQPGNKVTITDSTTAVAQWTAINYTTINFASTGVVSNLPDTMKVVSNGSTITLPSTIPTKINDTDGSSYTFMYWVDNTTPSNTYAPGDKLILGTGNKIITLTAVWAKTSPLQYVVSFNANGSTSGNPTNTSLGIDAGKEITIPGAGTMKKINFTFIGWSPDNGSTIYKEGDSLTINSNLTLSAVWMSDTTEGVLKFETRGASGSDPEMIKATTGTLVKIPNKNTDVVSPGEGYYFWGWAKSKTATYPNYYAGDTIAMPKGITTLYGVWAKTDYRYWAEVDISVNGASGNLPTNYKSINFYQLDSEDSTYTFTTPSAETLSLTGYTFGGWKDTNGKIYNAGDTIALTNESITKLTAIWNRITYKVSYSPGDATGGSVPSTDTTTVDYNGTYTLLPNSGSLVKKGSTFIGWNVNGTMYAPGQKVVITADTVITPIWTVNPTTPSNPSEHKATIVYRSTESGVTGDLPDSETLNVDYKTYYTVKNAKSNFKREGYTFIGWYTIDNSGNKVTYAPGSSFIITHSVVFYALWETEITPVENAYKISYNGNTNTSGLTPSTQYITEGSSLILPNQNTLKKVMPIDFNESTGTIDTSTNYLFVGWSTEKDTPVGDKSIKQAGEVVKPTADTVYYAIWDVELRNVSLTYDGNGNTGGTLPNKQVKNRYTEITVDESDAGATLTKVVDGTTYVFAGWNTKANPTKADPGKDYVRGSSLALNTDITLYAKWIPSTGDNTTRIIYIGNGNDEGDYVTYDDTSKASYTILGSGNRKKTGYIFTGWNTKADGSGDHYSVNDTIQTEKLSSLVLYAQWDLENRNVTLTYDGNGYTEGTLPTSQTEARYSSVIIDQNNNGSTLAKSILNPTTNLYDTYIFNGWNTKIDSSGVGVGVHYTSGSSIKLTEDTTLYAEWVATTGKEKMRITYLGNGNDSGSPITTIDTSEKTYTIDDIGNRSKTGHIFTHWNTKEDGSGTNYYPGQVIDTTVNSSLVLYAQWSVINNTGITIVYDGNQNTSGTIPASQNTTSGEKLTLADKGDLTRTGYTFVGWSESINPTSGSVIYAATGTATFKKNTVLYAVWAVDGDYVATAATINYYANYSTTDTTTPYIVKGAVDPSQTVDNKTVLSGHKIVANEKNGGAYLGEPVQFVTASTAAFSKTNYTFKGWATEKNSTEVTYKPGESIVLSNTELNLYGVWEVGTYTVKYDANDGQGAMHEQNFTYDAAQNLTANAFTRNGYTFAGWNTKKDGSGNQYNDAASVTNLAGTDQSITLYAQWQANTFTVVFNENGGKGTMPEQNFTYDVAQPLTANAFTRNGYTFTGWNTKKDGSGTPYTDTASVSNLTTGNGETVTLYAQWFARETTITFDPNGGTTKQTTITGKTDETIDLSSVVEATRTDYTFLGWFNGTEKIPASVTLPAGGIHYTAKWQANTFTVVFNENGGKGTMPEQNFTYDIAQPLTANAFTRNGYTFTGWNTKPDGTGISFADQELVSNLASGGLNNSLTKSSNLLTFNELSVTLYAQWSADNQFITFDPNGGTTKQTTITGKTDETIDLSSVVEATRTGYTFLGWFNGTEKIPASVTLPADGIHYTAKWQANSYIIIFDANTGAGTMTNQSFTYDTTQDLKANTFTKDGYSFNGWNTKPDGTGTKYTDKESVINLTTTNNDNVTLYAQWSVHTYQVAFDSNTLTSQGYMNNQFFTYDVAQRLTKNSYTRDGYTFTSWNTKKDGSGVAYKDAASVINLTTINNETVTLYAQWSAENQFIIFDANGGTTNQSTITGKTDEIIDLSSIAAATREGYTFLGWFTDKENTTKMPTSVVMPNNGITYYAHWGKNDPITNETTQNKLPSTSTTRKSLPNTGETTNWLFLAFGLILLFTVGIIRYKKRSEIKENRVKV